MMHRAEPRPPARTTRDNTRRAGIVVHVRILRDRTARAAGAGRGTMLHARMQSEPRPPTIRRLRDVTRRAPPGPHFALLPSGDQSGSGTNDQPSERSFDSFAGERERTRCHADTCIHGGSPWRRDVRRRTSTRVLGSAAEETAGGVAPPPPTLPGSSILGCGGGSVKP